MEIEFKNDDGEATGRKLYLQLNKSDDSYLRGRGREGEDIFQIKNAGTPNTGCARRFPCCW